MTGDAVTTEITSFTVRNGDRAVTIRRDNTMWLLTDGDELNAIYDDSLLDLAKQHAEEYLLAAAELDVRRGDLERDWDGLLGRFRDGPLGAPRHFTPPDPPQAA